jgi:glycerophosphoryl diester phosphodiesterase
MPDQLKRPYIIAHRGASGQMPEHTLEGYRKAIEFGADFIEPDLVMTKDHKLVARHDIYLSTTTNVSDLPEFDGRRRCHALAPGGMEGAGDWLVEDFTLDELRRLRARQAYPGRDAGHDDKYLIPTFEEILRLAIEQTAATGRPIGVYAETKHPGYHKDMGFDFAAQLLGNFDKAGAGEGTIPLILQSFEMSILLDLRIKCDLPLIYLVERGESSLKPDIKKIFQYIDKYKENINGIGPDKALLLDAAGRDAGFVGAAHERGLEVHPWTFRNDALPKGFSQPEDEYFSYFDLGIDAFFSDFSGTAFEARKRWLETGLVTGR